MALDAVLCRTGKITDITVIEGLPFGMTERVIEAARQILEITGLRSRIPSEIMAHLKTRTGEPYSQKQVTADLQSLLSLGFLDPKETRVLVEEGIRGGVNVVFELAEFPPK